MLRINATPIREVRNLRPDGSSTEATSRREHKAYQDLETWVSHHSNQDFDLTTFVLARTVQENANKNWMPFMAF